MAYYRNKFERTGGRKECKHGIQNITLALIVTLHSRLTWYILAQAIPRLVFIQISNKHPQAFNIQGAPRMGT